MGDIRLFYALLDLFKIKKKIGEDRVSSSRYLEREYGVWPRQRLATAEFSFICYFYIIIQIF